jgi:AhpC/TSA family/Dockerin type I domain
MRSLFTLLFVISITVIHAQDAPNFNVTDASGKVHNLYNDYLNKGKYVVLKVFFVDCPPCNTIAPSTQQKYVEWGSGNNDVQFIEMTNKIGDTDSRVNQYKSKHGITFPSISSQGGSLDAIIPYNNGTYGIWSGTPLFVVITPSKKVTYDVLFSNLEIVLESMGAKKAAPPNNIKLSIASPVAQLPQGVSYLLKSKSNPSISYNITQLTNGTNEFTYPSTSIPAFDNPVLVLQSTAPAGSPLLSVLDLVAIRNHIFSTTPFTQEVQKIAADVTGDGKISAADMLAIQKAISGVSTTFPNNGPSYKLYPSQIPLTVPSQGGGNVTMTGNLIKMGNVK